MSTVGTLDVLLRLQADDFTAGLRAVSDRAQELGARMTELGSALSVRVTTPLVGAGAAAVAAAVRLGRFADALFDLEQQTGLTTDELQQWRAVAVHAGVGADTVADAVKRMSLRFGDSGPAAAEVHAGLAALGVASRTATGELRPMGDVVHEALMRLSEMDSVVERNSLAMQIFGRSATSLAPVLGLGAAEIERITASAAEMGLVMSRDALAAADAFRLQWDILKASLGGVARELASVLMPLMVSLAGVMNDRVVPALRAIAERLSTVSPATLQVVAVVGALAAALGPLLVVMGTMISALGTVAGALGAVVPVAVQVAGAVAALNPVTVGIVAALGALGAAAYLLWRQWDEVASGLSAAWEAVRAAFESLADAVTGIGQAMMDAVIATWTSGLERVRAVVEGAVGAVTGLFRRLSDVVVGNSIVPDMVDAVSAEFLRMGAEMHAHTLAAAEATIGTMRHLSASVVRESEIAVAGSIAAMQELPAMVAVADVHTREVASSWERMRQSIRVSMDEIASSVRGTWQSLAQAVRDPVGALTDAAPWSKLAGGVKGALGQVLGGLTGGGGGGGWLGKAAGLAGTLMTGGVGGLVTSAVGGLVGRLFGRGKQQQQQAPAALPPAALAQLTAIDAGVRRVGDLMVEIRDAVRDWREAAGAAGRDLLAAVRDLPDAIVGPLIEALDAATAGMAAEIEAAMGRIEEVVGALGGDLVRFGEILSELVASLVAVMEDLGQRFSDGLSRQFGVGGGGGGGVGQVGPIYVTVTAWPGADTGALRGAVADGMVEGIDRALGRRIEADALQRGRVRL